MIMLNKDNNQIAVKPIFCVINDLIFTYHKGQSQVLLKFDEIFTGISCGHL